MCKSGDRSKDVVVDWFKICLCSLFLSSKNLLCFCRQLPSDYWKTKLLSGCGTDSEQTVAEWSVKNAIINTNPGGIFMHYFVNCVGLSSSKEKCVRFLDGFMCLFILDFADVRKKEVLFFPYCTKCFLLLALPLPWVSRAPFMFFSSEKNRKAMHCSINWYRYGVNRVRKFIP